MARERGLYRRKDSPYFWIDVILADGRRVCKSTRLREETAAAEFLIKLKAKAYERSRSGYECNKIWKDGVLRYLSENKDKRSLEDDKMHLRQLDPFLCEKRLEEISMETLWQFIHHRRDVDNVSNATINRALEIVRRILRLAHFEWHWLEYLPQIKLLKKPKRRIRFLEPEEADRLICALPSHLKPVVQFALATGCRMREILNLEWSRVDFARQVAWLDAGTTKTGDGRGIPLNRDSMLALRAVDGEHSKWCFTYKGAHMGKIGKAWYRALERAGIEDFRFHDLRHTWASWHVMNGTSLQELMELGGWKSYEMVLRYAHLAPEYLAFAAARIERPIESVGEPSTIPLR